MSKHFLYYMMTIVSLFLTACSEKENEKEKEITVDSIAISQPSAELEIGETLNLKATISPSNATYDRITWTSANTSVATVSSSGQVLALAEGNTTITAMAGGKTASCAIMVIKGYVAVSSISLNKESIKINEGNSETLLATVSPSDATDKTVSWTSSKESVATVKEGIITAVEEGEATITAKAGEKTASCKVMVTRMQTPEVIDLGLTVKWASFNLGASKPEECGDYYAWGETSPKDDYSWETYKWCVGFWDQMTKYCSDATCGYEGFKDNKTDLDPEDDAAHVNLGDKWRMPTSTELSELANCTIKETSVNGVGGLIIKGTNGNSIFLPAAGGYNGRTPPTVGVGAVYWSSSRGARILQYANSMGFTMGFGPDNPYFGISSRNLGYSIRPVYDGPVPLIPVQSVSLDKSELDLAVEQTHTLTATVKPSNATDKTIAWSSSNTSVATVSSSGIVTAITEGDAIITVTTNDGGKTSSCRVHVIDVPKKKAIVFASDELRKWLVYAFDTNKDGKLSYEEAEAVTSDQDFERAFKYIDVSKIESFEEFQYFTGLKTLSYWFGGWTSLKSIILPSSLISISGSFDGCISLERVGIPNSITSIGRRTFRGCKSLESMGIPHSVTSIEESTFEGCASLEKVSIPNSLTSIGERAFLGCNQLTDITIPNSVTSIGMFAFYECSRLSSISIPNSITSIAYSAFADCYSLESVSIPNSVTTIEHSAFYNCISLSSISIPNSVTRIEGVAFACCTSLSSISIPNSVTSIEYRAFRDCTKLTSIKVLPETPPKGGSDMFINTNSAPIYVPAGSVDSYKSADNWKNYADRIQAIPE